MKYFANQRQSKKTGKSVLSSITFFMEFDDRYWVGFKGETLTFTLGMLKSQL